MVGPSPPIYPGTVAAGENRTVHVPRRLVRSLFNVGPVTRPPSHTYVRLHRRRTGTWSVDGREGSQDLDGFRPQTNSKHTPVTTPPLTSARNPTKVIIITVTDYDCIRRDDKIQESYVAREIRNR